MLQLLDMTGNQNKFSMIQYWFDGPPVKVSAKPHGNSKLAQPYFRTAASAKAEHKEIAVSHTPKAALQVATERQGGELEAKGLNVLPRNLQQMKNYRRSEHKKDTNVLYSVMLQCKQSDGKVDAFVRDIKAAPQPQCILFYDWQINDLKRFLTNSCQFSIFTIDTTYNLGDFYVTPTTYQHLLLEDSTSGKHPHFLGPILIHYKKNFSAFNYLACTLIEHCQNLRDIQAFGSDGDPALVEALSHNFPIAKQLRCFIHLKRNITEKLKERGISSSDMQEFLADIFGKHVGTVYWEGLVSAEDCNDFDAKLANCERVWKDREAKYNVEWRSSFFDYFTKNYSGIICHCMLKDLRISVGLGVPPAIYTTNACESLNAVIKRKVNYKESEWPEFNNQMKQLIDRERDEAVRALSGRGQYRLCKKYTALQVCPSEWVKMRPEQRKKVVARFNAAKLVNQESHTSSTSAVPSTSSGVSLQHETAKHLSISSKSCGINSLPQAVIDSMWLKAEAYIESSCDIVPAPGVNPKAKMVASRSGDTPHYVRALPSGQYVCDGSCLQWKSSQICSHTLAVSGKNGDLESFLCWYNRTNQQPNITTLSMQGLPKGRGRKGGVPKRQRSQPVSTSEISVPRAALCTTPSISSPDTSNPVSSNVSFHQSALSSQSSVSLSTSGCHIPVSSDTISTMSVPSSLASNTSGHNIPISSDGSLHVSQSASNISNVASPFGSLLTQNVTLQMPPNTNPFFLRAIEGNIRVCQGCKTSLRSLDGSVPLPPYDFTVARFEKRQYRDKNGTLCTPQREQAVHYHIKLACIYAVCREFVPSSLIIPEDVRAKLNSTHKEYLRLMFGLTL